MGGQRTSFSKLQRDRDKKAKAAAKRERRQERSAATADETVTDTMVDDGVGELSADELLRAIESIHQRFEAKTITYEEYEEQKADLLSRLPVD
jgi:predicted RNA-binding protein with PIN domain